MPSMKQANTDHAKAAEAGARKTSPDSKAKIREPITDRDRGRKAGETGERQPKGDTSSDMTGERKGRLIGGVAMGKADDTGKRDKGVGQHEGVVGEFNEGRMSGDCYTHGRKSCQ